MQPQLGQVAAAMQLVEFDSCADALAQLKRAAATYVSPYGLDGMWAEQAGGAPIPISGVARNEASFETGAAGAAGADAAAPEYSSTNTHEVGVDEPDLVKTDGRRIVSVVDGTLRVVDAEKRQLIGTLPLSDPAGTWYAEHLLLSGDRALILGYGNTEIGRGSSVRDAIADLSFAPEGSRLVLVDISGEPRIVSELDLEGSYVDARQVDSVARIVVRSGPRLAWTYPAEPGAQVDALAANRDVVARSTIDDWLPHFALTEDGDRTEGRVVDCADVSHPRAYSGTSMLTVLTVDIAGGALRPDNAVAVVADGQTVYGTGSSLYISGYQSPAMPVDSARALPTVGEEKTEIHKFDVESSGKPEYVASGVVDGWLLNQYSMSAHEGHLRVATTRSGFSPARAPDEPPPSESQVTVLAQQGAQLAEVGVVGGLGKGEQIYAVRFIGPVGYVVTFRQVDPLYTLDLSNPRSPRVVGELKIPGYSAYLHPAGDGRLIGVGQDADEQGMTRGTQISLFDVADAASPARLDTFLMPGGWSDAEHDPHAFLYWPDDELVVLPVWWEGGASVEPGPTDIKPFVAQAGGAVVVRIDGNSLSEVGSLTHVRSAAESQFAVDPTIRRSLVIGDTLWTLSPSGALASDLDDLDELAWVPFTA
ncbi:MAG TPA: beta-propeller domain-containing protein [Jiangellaceae bacterium]|nr:beta-propeller domain-containing protein [Jiangellaceae bacterium]